MFKQIIGITALALISVGLTLVGWRTIQVDCTKLNGNTSCAITETFAKVYTRNVTVNNVLDVVEKQSTKHLKRNQPNYKSKITVKPSLQTTSGIVGLTAIGTSTNNKESELTQLSTNISTFLKNPQELQFKGKTQIKGILGYIGLFGLFMTTIGFINFVKNGVNSN